MKKNNCLNKSISLILLFWLVSLCTAFSAPTLKNNPVQTSPAAWGEPYITGTTFSIANDNSETDKTYFKLSEIIFGRPLATLEMSSKYQEYNGVWDNSTTESNPNYAILSNPAVLNYAEKQDGINRLICQMPNQGETILKLKVAGYKAGTDFTMSMKVEELSGESDVNLSMTLNGVSIGYSTLSVSSGGSKIWEPYKSALDASELEIEIKLESGTNAIVAFSDLYVYGGIEAFSISASSNVCSLGEEVTLTAFSSTDINLGRVLWKKRTTSPDWFDLTDDAGAPKIGETVKDKPEAGETCYKAEYYDASGNLVESNVVCVTAEYKCAANSAHVLFTEDFGQLSGETERDNGGYGGEVEYINTQSYTYVGDCKPLKENGTYAIMTNPKYGGYGGLENNADACSNIDMGNLWFRDLYDHTSEGLKDGEWGAMLMVNAASLDGQAEQLVYSRTVDMPCPNTNMIFSAWFANAANPERVGDGIKVSMKFVVRDQNGDIIPSATLIVDEIVPSAGWVKGETSFNSGDNTQLTVEIYNCTEGGTGNDFMVDDISFSVCTPEVTMSASSEDANVKINAEKSLVEGKCGSEITLSLATGMADVIFDDPQYLWYVKGAGDSDFRFLNYNVNKTKLDTVITAWTEYYAVVTANESDREAYIAGELSVCTPVAISNSFTLLCVPELSVQYVNRVCNEIELKAIVEDGPVDFKWQISKNGTSWTDIPNSKNQETFKHNIDISAYFRITTVSSTLNISSEPTEQIPEKVMILDSFPFTISQGDPVALGITSISMDLEYSPVWYKYVDGEPTLIEIPEFTYRYEIPSLSETTIYEVEWEQCTDTAIVRVLNPIRVEIVSRICNDISLKAVVNEAYENFYWESSNDGTTWSKVQGSDNKITLQTPITETTYFRINNSSNKPSEPTEAVEVRTNVLTVDKEKVLPGEKVNLTSTTNYTSSEQFYWYKGNDRLPSTTNTCEAEVTEYIKFYVVYDGCTSNVLFVDVYDVIKVNELTRVCNTVTLETNIKDNTSFVWQKSNDGGITWEDMPETDKKIIITITEDTQYRVKTDDMQSDPTAVYSVWSLELTADKQTIDFGEQVTLSVNSNFDKSIIWYENEEEVAKDVNSYIAKPITSTSYIVEKGGCTSNEVLVDVIRPEFIWPTAFNPLNNDGVNDTFMQGYGIKMLIMDRYGNVVSESEDGWDGTIKGANAMPGVYFYVATLPDETIKKGTIELVHYVK